MAKPLQLDGVSRGDNTMMDTRVGHLGRLAVHPEPRSLRRGARADYCREPYGVLRLRFPAISPSGIPAACLS